MNSLNRLKSPQRFLAGVFILSFLPFLMVELFPSLLYVKIDISSYLVFHNISGFFSVMVSLSIFGLGWYSYDQSKDQHALFLSSAFLAIGLMDFMHTMSYAGMPAFITPNSPNKSAQFWIAVRFFSASVFLASAFVYSDKPNRLLSRMNLIIAALAVSGLVFMGITFFPLYMPTAFIEGVGLTPFKKISEYIIICLLMLASALYWKRMSRTGDQLIIYYLAAFALGIISEIVFSVYKNVFDTYNALGHVYIVLAFYLIYKGIFVASINKPYEKLIDTNDMLQIEIKYRKQAEAVLQDSESRMRAMLHAVPDLIFRMDSKGIFLDYKAAASDLYTQPVSNIIGKRNRDSTPPEFDDLIDQQIRSTLATDTLHSFEYTLPIQGRGIRDYEARMVKSGADEVTTIVRDITERKEIAAGMEKTRKELEVIKITADQASELAENIINTVREPLIILDHNLQVVKASSSFYKFFHVKPENTVGQRIYNLGNKQWDIPMLRELLETILPQKTTFDNYEVEHDFAIIGKRTMLLNARQIQQVLGKERIILLAIEDITERKQAEEVIKSNMAFQDVLMDAVPSPIFYKDAAGVYIGSNKAFERCLGLSPEQFIGKTVADISPANLAEKYNEADRELLNNPGFQTYEALVVYADGTRHNVVFNKATFTNAKGKIAGLVGVILDITEHKKAEEVLQELNRQLEVTSKRADDMAALANKANQAKSLFLANMSHEIRTPMNAILGFAQVLKRDPALTARQTEQVRIITRSGNQLLMLINDILDISKIEAGKITLNETTFCLHDLLDDLDLMFQSRTKDMGLQLLIEVDKSVPRYVTGDEGKLREIFINLMGNAAKFTKKGWIATRVRTETMANENKALRLVAEVEDTGPGIPAEDIDRIFVAFQQAETGVKTGGTGLGLAISSKFVEMLGGKLTVTSQVGKGSCFQFEVLLKTAAEIDKLVKPALRRIIGLESGTKSLRILVVDDIADNRALFCALLQPIGFEIAEASNGIEALEVFGKWLPHAIFMDMRMPVMDGYETCRRIKATEAGQVTFIIGLTASIFEDSQQQVMDAGGDAYLKKPFQVEELLELLGKGLGLGLRYVYDEEKACAPDHLSAQPLMLESLAVLPQEIIKAMRQAVEECDITRLTGLIVQVEKIDSATAHGLQALADRYDYAKLSQWLAKGEMNNE